MDRQIIGAERPVNWVVHIRAKSTHVFLFRSVEWVCKGGGGKKEREFLDFTLPSSPERERHEEGGGDTEREKGKSKKGYHNHLGN